jgi:hypothetical protein
MSTATTRTNATEAPNAQNAIDHSTIQNLLSWVRKPQRGKQITSELLQGENERDLRRQRLRRRRRMVRWKMKRG